MTDTLRTRWQLDLDQIAAKIPDAWLIRDGDFVGVHPDHRDNDLVRLYAGLTQVGYAKGWLS